MLVETLSLRSAKSNISPFPNCTLFHSFVTLLFSSESALYFSSIPSRVLRTLLQSLDNCASSSIRLGLPSLCVRIEFDFETSTCRRRRTICRLVTSLVSSSWAPHAFREFCTTFHASGLEVENRRSRIQMTLRCAGYEAVDIACVE